VRFLQSGKQALSGGLDGTLRVWDVRSGRLLRTMGPQEFGVQRADLSANGRVALSSGVSGGGVMNHFWDVEKGAELATSLSQDHLSIFVALSPDGQSVFGLTSQADLWLWNVRNGREIRQQLIGYTGGGNGVAFSPDGKYVVTDAEARRGQYSIRPQVLWDVATGREIRRFGEPQRQTWTACFTANGKRVVLAHWLGLLSAWEIASGKNLCEFEAVSDRQYPPTTFAFTSDGKLVFVASGQQKTKVSGTFIRAGDLLFWSAAGTQCGFQPQQRGSLLHPALAAKGATTLYTPA